MAEQKDIRWKQRFQNLQNAVFWLKEAVQRVADEPNDRILRSGLIQNFEFTFELSWKTMKDFLSEQGIEVKSPKETLRQAIQLDLVHDGDSWMKALADRNITSHAYEEDEVQEVADAIASTYFPLINALIVTLRNEL